MSRILCVWELGNGLGHIGPMSQLGAYFKALGHDVFFALRDVSSAETFLGQHEFKWFAAPVWRGGHRGAPAVPVSYSEVLLGSGYQDENSLLSLVKSWQALYDTVQPDLVLFDYAPTALLAARGRHFRRVVVGTGFHTPPSKSPIPSFRPDMPIPLDRLVNNEGVVLETINRALAALKQTPLNAVCELFAADENFLCTFPELDHYQDREGGNYCGPIFNHTTGASPIWQSASTKKIFAYVKPEYTLLDHLARQLNFPECETLIYVPGLPPAFAMRYPHLRFSDRPIKIGEAVNSCDLAICHGGTLTSAFLLGGVPLLLLPMHAEQLLTARNAERIGVAKALVQFSPAIDFSSSIRTLLMQSPWRDSARAFAKKYEDFSVSKALEKIGARCAELIQ
jgi:hypothetical protein